MTIELDHIFVCTALGGPEAACLIDLGFTEGTPNTHAGQGTACRRFFFRNAYLELLWVNDPSEAQAQLIRPTHLWERWGGRDRGACPFGLCFRAARGETGPAPFSTWEYRPPYLPSPLSIAIAKNAHLLQEPMLCHLPFHQRPDAYPAPKRQPLDHVAGRREITHVELISSHTAGLSPELQAVLTCGPVRFRKGEHHYMEVVFDGESQGEQVDLRAALPFKFRW